MIYGQNKTINIPLETRTNYANTNKFTYLYKGSHLKFNGIPKDLTSKNSIIKYSLINDQDTLFMIVGDWKENERICIIDADMNHDFSDNYRYIYLKDCLSANTFFPSQPIVFESKEKRKETCFVRPVLHKINGISFGIDNDTQMNYFLMLGLSEYYTGKFRINNKQFTITIKYLNCFNKQYGFEYAINDSLTDNSSHNKNFKSQDVAVNIEGYSIKPLEISEGNSYVSVILDSISDMDGNRTSGIEEGFSAMPFNSKDIYGKVVSSEDFKGKYLLIDFWGTWCNPCIQLLPHLSDLYKKYKSLSIVSIAYEVNPEGVAKLPYYINKHQMEWINICEKDFTNEDRICDLFKVSSFPTTILIDPKGVIIHRGGSGDMQKLNEILEHVLQNM